MGSFKVKRKLSILGDQMYHDAFINLIRRSEKGPFNTLDDIQAKVILWQQSFKIKTK